MSALGEIGTKSLNEMGPIEYAAWRLAVEDDEAAAGEAADELEALRARIRTLDGLADIWTLEGADRTGQKRRVKFQLREIWPELADALDALALDSAKAALDGALGQANGHDDAAGSCPPKIEGA